MSWPYPRIVAHRGGGTLAPENTLGAIRLGASMGFSGVEFDVMLAGDATPVLIHDETVDRTTDGRGAVARMTYQELLRVNIRDKTRKEEKIPTFEAAARLCRELGVWANVEIKPALGYDDSLDVFGVHAIGGIIGWSTNWLAVKMIFRPLQPWRLLWLIPIQGLVPRRQDVLD